MKISHLFLIFALIISNLVKADELHWPFKSVVLYEEDKSHNELTSEKNQTNSEEVNGVRDWPVRSFRPAKETSDRNGSKKSVTYVMNFDDDGYLIDARTKKRLNWHIGFGQEEKLADESAFETLLLNDDTSIPAHFLGFYLIKQNALCLREELETLKAQSSVLDPSSKKAHEAIGCLGWRSRVTAARTAKGLQIKKLMPEFRQAYFVYTYDPNKLLMLSFKDGEEIPLLMTTQKNEICLALCDTPLKSK
jgi:hypothetical protein